MVTDDSCMETLMAVLLGVSVSAACGFRIFVPMLVVSMAARLNWLTLDGGFEWLGSDVALIAFAVATVAEIVAYYVPVVDNFLDAAGVPLAAIAGTCLTAAMVTDMSPFLQWTLGIIAGGGSATLVHGATSTVRAAATSLTGGLGNSIVATTEDVAAGGVSLLALVSPVLAISVLLLLLALIVWLVVKWRKRRRERLAACL